MKRIVVFASGSGTNFQSIIDAIDRGEVSAASIAGLIVSNSNAFAISRAEKAAIPTAFLHPNEFKSYQDYEIALKNQLLHWNPDLIALAGYLLKIPESVIELYKGRILNIHPSLLPKYGGRGYYGLRVHRAVLENSELKSGCTVHLVTEEYDEGPILGQIEVAVLQSDTPETLQKRVLEKEHILYPKIINQHLKTLA